MNCKKQTSKPIRLIAAKRKNASGSTLPNIISDPPTVFSFPRCLLALSLCPSISDWRSSPTLTDSQNSDVIRHHNLLLSSSMCLPWSPRPHEILLKQTSTHVSPSSQLLPEEKNTAAAPTVTQYALSRLQGKPVIYSLLYIHSSRGNTRGYSWDGVLLRWRSMPLPPSLSPSHILGLGIT